MPVESLHAQDTCFSIFFLSPPVSNVFYRLYKNWDFTIIHFLSSTYPVKQSYSCFCLKLKFLFQHLLQYFGGSHSLAATKLLPSLMIFYWISFLNFFHKIFRIHPLQAHKTWLITITLLPSTYFLKQFKKMHHCVIGNNEKT